MPIFYWKKIQDDGNLSYVVRSASIHISKREPGWLKRYALTIAWRKLMDEYIARFGFSEEFIDIIRKHKEIASYVARRLHTGDNTLIAFQQIAELELENMTKANKAGDFFELKATIETQMGFIIDPMRVSVGEFYSYITLIRKKKRTKNG